MSIKILGLDIGSTSVGWAIVEATVEKKVNDYTGKTANTDINNDRIGIYKDAVGVRIINQDTERFDKGLTLNDPKGNTLTPTATRRKYRSSRRMKSRYKLRRGKLKNLLSFLKMTPDENYFTHKKGKRGKENDIGKAIYLLRDRATREKISLAEWGRILLHLNQFRGYNSDKFSKDEKPKFDYHIAEVLDIDLANKLEILQENSNEVKYYKIAIKLKFEEPFNTGDEINKQLISEISGYLFKKDIDLKTGDIITIKNPELKQNKRGKTVIEEYYKITLTTPDPADWNYKYQTLQKSLKEWTKSGGTVGSYFFHNFYQTQNILRIRNNVVNRQWYENELDKIWDTQFKFHQSSFENLNIEDAVKAAFLDHTPILNEVLKKEGISEQLKFLIKDKIIFFQRPWQQTKNKGRCPFEKIPSKKEITRKGEAKKEFITELIGRSVIPRSHPLFQEFKIWQQINNVRLFLNTPDKKIDLFNDKNEFNKHVGKIIGEVKELLYNELQNTKTLSWRAFVKDVLNIQDIFDESDDYDRKRRSKHSKDTETGENANSYYSVNFRKRKKDGTYDDIKLKGNSTKNEIQKILIYKDDAWFNAIHSDKQQISNLQFLWEIIYDITNNDKQKVAEIIEKHFGFDENTCIQLAGVNFDDTGMANLSAKAIRQMLPLMSNGKNITEKTKRRVQSLINQNIEEQEKSTDEKLESLKNFIPDKKTRVRLSKFSTENDFTYLNYWEAAATIYGTHSTKSIEIQPEIQKVKLHSMNNPVVEKIVNETISVVNEIYKTYGFDEIRIELSRELKASMEERQQIWEGMIEGANKNEWAKQMLREAKQALLEDERDIENLDTDVANKSNIDKIKIIEDIVKYNKAEEYKNKIKEFKLNEPTKAEVKKYLLWLEQHFKCPYTNQPIPFTDVFARGKVVEVEHILPRERYYSNSYANKVLTWKEVNVLKGNRTAYEFIVSKRDHKDSIFLPGRKLPIGLVPPNDWESHVKSMFPKGGKRNNMLRKEIPEDPIERTLKETQYINKKLKEKLAELVGYEKVWVTSGAVTDILRERWHLNNVMKELMRNRFEKFNTGEKKEKMKLVHYSRQFNNKKGKWEDVEVFEGYSKRLDYRHNALDAIIIACTKQNHIQYINTLNAINTADQEDDEAKKIKYNFIKKDICVGNSSNKFRTPWEEGRFVSEVMKILKEVIIAHKNTRLLISPSKHRINKEIKSAKPASIRGELHKETNYAKRKYYEGGKTDITKLIPLLFREKQYNQSQTMVHFKLFDEIIRETVLKEKYQAILSSIFKKYDQIQLNDKLAKELSKEVLKSIEENNLLVNTKTGEPLSWLSTYSDKDKSNRPIGLLINLNDEKEVKSIANPRIRRLAGYRLKYVNEQIAAIDTLNIDKKDKDLLKAKIKNLKLYSNAIYEIRVKKGENDFEWIELKDLSQIDLNQICYASPAVTKQVKEKMTGFNLVELKKSYFEFPVFLSDKKIEVKKARQKAYFQDLYEITKGRYVYSQDTFMVYFFQSAQKQETDMPNSRIVKFLKFIDAVSIINTDKPETIDYKKLIEKEKTIEEFQNDEKYNLIFTLAKNDMVYLPETNLTEEQMKEINWQDKSSLLPYLYIVKEMNPSLKKIAFQQISKADAITISEADVKSLFHNSELKEQIEEIKYGTVPMLQRCIKVFTDKLGRKIVPYWEFSNGCWNKKQAKQLGLLI